MCVCVYICTYTVYNVRNIFVCTLDINAKSAVAKSTHAVSGIKIIVVCSAFFFFFFFFPPSTRSTTPLFRALSLASTRLCVLPDDATLEGNRARTYAALASVAVNPSLLVN